VHMNGTPMHLLKRLRRLGELSMSESDTISREEYRALMAHLKELDVEMKHMNHRVSDWIGVLMKSELLRRELEGISEGGTPGKSVH
jgi:hypothetical protein